MITSLKQRITKFELRITLNHNLGDKNIIVLIAKCQMCYYGKNLCLH